MSFTAFGPVYKAAAALLPAKMDTPAAWAMLFAIAMQESRLDARRQIGGPAHGFWEFELGGIQGVLNHPTTYTLIRSVLARLDYGTDMQTSYVAVEHNDVLAFCYARLLLYRIPASLPARDNPQEGWMQYFEAWRPGAPHRSTWDSFYETAWINATKSSP